jgi:hypothetical protein
MNGIGFHWTFIFFLLSFVLNLCSELRALCKRADFRKGIRFLIWQRTWGMGHGAQFSLRTIQVPMRLPRPPPAQDDTFFFGLNCGPGSRRPRNDWIMLMREGREQKDRAGKLKHWNSLGAGLSAPFPLVSPTRVFAREPSDRTANIR